MFVDRNQLVLLTSGSTVQLAGTVENLVLDSSVLALNTQIEPVIAGGENVYHPIRGMYARLIDAAFANDGAVSIPPGSMVYVLPASLVSPVAKQPSKSGGKDTLEPVSAMRPRGGMVVAGSLLAIVVAMIAFRVA